MEDWDNLDDFKKKLNKFGKQAIKNYEVYEKWNDLGFLNSISNDIKIEVAISLEEMSRLLILDNELEISEFDEKLQTISFAAIINIAIKTEQSLINKQDIKSFLIELNSFIHSDEIKKTIKELSICHMNIDVEAEVLHIFIKYKVESYDMKSKEI